MTPSDSSKPRSGRIVALTVLLGCGVAAAESHSPIPFVKQWAPGTGVVQLARVTISRSDRSLANEIDLLRTHLDRAGLTVGQSGLPIRLQIAAIDIPTSSSAYRTEIQNQGYRIQVSADGVLVQAQAPAGMFYGIGTLIQLIDREQRLPCGEVVDWPDLAVRGIMVDPARANENADYYQRLIRFCGRYKINRLHLHLTDDQNACLFHEDYPTLMHRHAWRPERLAPLIELAKQHHIEVVPEIESLGHARLFLRHPDFRELLHQTTRNKTAGSWTGTNVPGYTNVLCPASAKTYEYLDKMYARAAQAFPWPEIHVGCDEVDLTTCGRCAVEFPGLSHPEWFLRHLLRCRDLVGQRGRRLGMWGDMLLRHREIVGRLPTEGTVIYDWHYQPDVSGDSVAFFKERGFEVIACPALMCYPRMILPSADNYENIRRFAEIARTQDILGVDTTVWIPTRYLSDVLWPGIAYAAGQAWSGSNWDESAFYRSLADDFFGSNDGDAFAEAWKGLAAIDWRLQQFRLSCWSDGPGLAEAKRAAEGDAGDQARRYLHELQQVIRTLADLRDGIGKNRIAYQSIEQSAGALTYVLEHFLATSRVRRGGQWNIDFVGELDRRCVEAIKWIQADWDRNRFADDPGQADPDKTGQHLLHAFQQMHAYHERLLADSPHPRLRRGQAGGDRESRRTATK
ncbi:MAG: family 20 glycosylhydrolase [bacterium]|nr:family 20 glycosylhydrolase [bacterium]